MIIDGRTLAREVLVRTKARAEKLAHPPRVLAIVANETFATKSYLAIKTKRAIDAGCVLEVQYIKSSLRPFETIDMSKNADALIVQMPLLDGMNQKEILNSIPIEKDADVLSDAARQKFARGDADACVPPVVVAVREIFTRYDVNPKGKLAVVVGNGWLVGNPCAIWLKQQGANVEIITLESRVEARTTIAQADIIVSGAGSPHFIKLEMLKRGVVLIDAGTSESSGEVIGDADPACAEKCSIFTPVPGGVGPLAVACLFENVVTLAERTIYT